MGSSFTEFRGKGFWSHDFLLEAWLRILSLHLGDEVYQPGWQHDLRDEWLLKSAGFFGGCISPSLDDFLTDAQRVEVVLGASKRCIEKLRAFGDYVPAAFLNSLGLIGPFVDKDLPIEWFSLIFDRFTTLLKGELSTDASTSPVLPATRHREKWDDLAQPRIPQSPPL
jgi:hypothetical protein